MIWRTLPSGEWEKTTGRMSASPNRPPTQNAAARRWMKSVTVAASSMPGVAAPWLVVLRVAMARAVTRNADIQSASIAARGKGHSEVA